jgi:signal transduction histidine kinase
MKLRDRLLLFSTAQLLVFGALFALAYAAFDRTVPPMFERLLCDKTERVARLTAAALDLPLATHDHDAVAHAVAELVADPDFAYVAVRDTRRYTVYAHGEPSRGGVFDDDSYRARVVDDQIEAWAPVALEDEPAGAVAVGFRTARVAAIGRWAARLAVSVTLIWLLALLYALGFARSVVAPIRAMMEFSRKVAGGALSERLEIAAPGELRALRDHLNQMTADLECREADLKLAAAHAQDMQAELLAVSRVAGMAEVATGVLHNVRNVLTSLNTSVSAISDQVRSSRIAGLTRSIELVDRYPGGLPAFLATERGKVLPSYLSTVSRRLSEENAKVLAELGSINRHVDHIKSIVAMQQSCARSSSMLEPVALPDLIDDALQLSDAASASRGIAVVKDCPSITVTSDRHKLLQILINLIANARRSLEDRRATGAAPVSPAPPQLTVRVRQVDGHVEIAVIDNGVGIPAGDLHKIFHHGFTTKHGGHGFGLHTSATAARELGGSLQAASDGPGKGATFTLELPAAAGEDFHDLGN